MQYLQPNFLEEQIMINLKPLKPEEAIKFFKDKVKLKSSDFYNLYYEARSLAFTVSQIAKYDQLETIYNAIYKALDEGISFNQFKEEIADIIAEKGWTGKRAWRVENIFRTNIQTAYMVGKYKNMAENIKNQPYWMYDAVNDSRTRPTHLALDEKVFPANHPFWDKWYPPNGYNCRCSVIPLSEEQVKRHGFKIETKDPTGTLIEPIDPTTGLKRPAIPLLPDPYFDTNPGKNYYGNLVNYYYGKAKSHGKFVDMVVFKTFEDYKLPKAEDLPPKNTDDLTLPSYKTLKKDLSQKEIKEYYKKAFINTIGGEEVKLIDPIGEAIKLDISLFEHFKINDGRMQYIPYLKEIAENPNEIWLIPMQAEKSKKIVLRKRHIYMIQSKDSKKPLLLILDAQNGIFTGWTFFKESSLTRIDKQRKGIFLYSDSKK